MVDLSKLLFSLSLFTHDAVGQVGGSWINTSLPPAGDLLRQAIDALGGRENLAAIKTVSYIGETTYRTRTLMEAYSLDHVDRSVATAGRQNISFSYEGENLKQRIDRVHNIDPFFIFARPSLEPLDYALVIQDGDNGFASVVKGSNSIFTPSDLPPSGYTDGLLAAYLIHEANQMSPFLVYKIFSNNRAVASYEDVGSRIHLPAVHDPDLNLTVILDPETHLPYIIRSFEEHAIYGPSTNDLLVYNYTSVKGIMLPQRFKRVYNNEFVLLDFFADSTEVNIDFDPALFEASGTIQVENIPARDPAYDFAEINEWSSAYVWSGSYRGSLANLSATQPFDDLPGLWVLDFQTGYVQMVLDLDDKVVVFDAPPHQSFLVLQWVNETLGKPVTHVWPSHHHHDHSMGLRNYVDVGITVITWDEAEEYYSNIPKAKFTTYSSGSPLTINDESMELSFVHIEGAVHALDQSYAIVLPTCRAMNSSVAVYAADYWDPGFAPNFDQGEAVEFMNKLKKDQVARRAAIIPAHGVQTPLEDLIGLTGFLYPNYTAIDFASGSSKC